LVQSELHPADEGREVDGNPGEPHADAAAPRVFEAVDDRSAETLAVSETDRSPERLALPEPAHADGARAFQASDGDGAAPSDLPAIIPAVPVPLAPADDLRLTSPGIRLSQLKEEFVAWVKTLMSAAVYAVLIVTFGFQVARVEGQSMAPTLEDQDRLIVNKLVYRIGEPRRGDIVMLYYPLNPDKSFVKRVIAEEGDTVRIVDGRVYVNDIPLKDDYVASEYRSHDDWGPQVIPEGYYFVMGDHRNNSSDSRHWGMVPKKYIIGKVQIRWWPVPTARVF
jgi:signal peptidase I